MCQVFYIKFLIKKEEITVIFKDNGKGFDIKEVDENPDIKNKFKLVLANRFGKKSTVKPCQLTHGLINKKAFASQF